MAVNPHDASAAASLTPSVWAPPGSLTATSGILSFPRGTEMFQFPRFPPPRLYIQRGVIRYHPDGVAPFGYPRIFAYPRLPEAFRGLVTSFFGSRCQGIHRVPFTRIRLQSPARQNQHTTTVLTSLVLAPACHSHTPTHINSVTRSPRPVSQHQSVIVVRTGVAACAAHTRLTQISPALPCLQNQHQNHPAPQACTQMRVPRCSCLTRLRVSRLLR